MKKLSAGVILTDGRQLLALHPWGNKGKLDIPKGEVDEGERVLDGAIRELGEEAGILANPSMVKSLGVFSYTREKDLALFIWKMRRLPPVRAMKCTSYFETTWGQRVPEVIAFEHVDFDDDRFYKSLQPILKKIQKALR